MINLKSSVTICSIILLPLLVNGIKKSLKEIIAEADALKSKAGNANGSSDASSPYVRDESNIKLIKIFHKLGPSGGSEDHEMSLDQTSGGQPRMLKIVISKKVEGQVITEAKDKRLKRMHRQMEIYEDFNLDEDENSLMKLDYAGRDEDDKSYYNFCIEDSSGLNLNNYLKKNNVGLVDKIRIMREMAKALSILHGNGILHCSVFLKKYVYDSSLKELKLTNVGLVNENGVCDHTDSESQEPDSAHPNYKLDLSDPNAKFTQDVYGLSLSYLAMFDRDMENAIETNKGIIKHKTGDNCNMKEYVKNLFHYRINELTTKILSAKLEEVPALELEKFVLGKINDIIPAMMRSDHSDRLTIFDVLRVFNILYATIRQYKHEPITDTDVAKLQAIFDTKEDLMGSIYSDSTSSNQTQSTGDAVSAVYVHHYQKGTDKLIIY